MSKIYIGTTLVSDNGAANISDLVDGAPDALNTLRELAENFEEGIRLTALSDVEIKDGKVGTLGALSLTDSVRTAGTYQGLNSSSSLSGTGAKFNVVVHQSIVLTIDTTTLSTQTDSNRPAGNYDGVTTEVSPSGGTGLTFDVLVNGGAVGLTIVDRGTGYSVGDTITISNADLGNVAGVADVTFPVATLTSNVSSVTVHTAGTAYVAGETITITEDKFGQAGAVADNLTFDVATLADSGIMVYDATAAGTVADPHFINQTFEEIGIPRLAGSTFTGSTSFTDLVVSGGADFNTLVTIGANTNISNGGTKILLIGDGNEANTGSVTGKNTMLSVGKDNVMNAERICSIGQENEISGDNSLTVGKKNITKRSRNIALGEENIIGTATASVGNNAIAIGYQNTLEAGNSFIAGNENKILNPDLSGGGASAILGSSNEIADGFNNFLIGANNNVTAETNNAIGIGKVNSLSGTNSIAIGTGLKDFDDNNTIMLGQYNADPGGTSKIIIGSGYNDGSRFTAIEILGRSEGERKRSKIIVNSLKHNILNSYGSDSLADVQSVASGELYRNNSFVMVRGDTSLSTTNTLTGNLTLSNSTHSKGLSLDTTSHIYQIGDIDGENNGAYLEINDSPSGPSAAIFNACRVGIGKTPDSGVELDVSGDIKASGSITVGNSLIGNVQGNLTGTAPTAPTAASGTNTTQIATTAFVQSAVQGEDTIAEMNDVTLTSLADGELLVSSSGDFINQTLAEAGIAPAASPIFSGNAEFGGNVSLTSDTVIDFDGDLSISGDGFISWSGAQRISLEENLLLQPDGNTAAQWSDDGFSADHITCNNTLTCAGDIEADGAEFGVNGGDFSVDGNLLYADGSLRKLV